MEVIRKNVKQSKVSFAVCSDCFYPSVNDETLIRKTAEYNFDRADAYSISWFTDPIFFRRFPEKLVKTYPKIAETFTEEDFKSVAAPLDFLGFNIYTGSKTALDETGRLKILENEAGGPISAMSWPVREQALYWMLKFLYERYKAPVIICENGIALNDWVALDGKVHDEGRIDYLRRHIRAMQRAYAEGVDIRGYFVWSLMDNFEWSYGYAPRFGLVHVDYQTQKRTIKESGYWYSDFIQSNKNQVNEKYNIDKLSRF